VDDGLVLTLFLAFVLLGKKDSGTKPKPEGTLPVNPKIPAGWVPDVPVRQAVADRAVQLLPILWAQGEGSSVTELVDEREVMFIAQWHGPKTKGITAYRRIDPNSSTSSHWTDQDMRAFVDYLSPLGIPLKDSLLVYTAESGLDPKAHSSAAWGIPQLTASTMKSLGWTRPASEFASLTVSEQIPWIAKLQASQIAMIGYVPKNALELYVANFSPVAAKNRSERIYEEGTLNYEANKGLDRDHKGYIAPSDLDVSLKQASTTSIYRHAITQLERVNQ
jgi:hypothetical protein